MHPQNLLRGYRIVVRSLCLLAILLILAGGTSGLACGLADGCHGVESERAEVVLEKFLTDENWTSLREEYNISTPAVHDLRVMTDAEDPAACAEIVHGGEEDSRFDVYFYTTGSYYYRVQFPKHENGEQTAPRGSFLIYDQNLNPIVGSLI